MKLYHLICLTLMLLAVSLCAQQPASQPPGQQPNKPTATPTEAPPDDPLLGIPPLPKGKPTLLGGTVTGIDRVRNRVALQPFGSHNKIKVQFDERTHIYRDGVETTQLGIRKGDRVYVDTMLVEGRVFAKNIHVQTHSEAADARGQVVAYDPATGRMVLREQLSNQELTFQLNSNTAVRREQQTASASELRPGSLVAVQFAPDRGSRGVAREVSILATPGSAFTFAGQVVHLDLRMGVLAVQNRTDQKTYEVHFDPRRLDAAQDLRVGSEITVSAVFDGSQYNAERVTVTKAGGEE